MEKKVLGESWERGILFKSQAVIVTAAASIDIIVFFIFVPPGLECEINAEHKRFLPRIDSHLAVGLGHFRIYVVALDT